ncbi:MAG: hypothetical protein HC934_00640 [Acaryochloridaceae cyanobacterium SU_2_1]|nr:hypothetical protein [Acaryochloridaceae cyanobacterium SU_2_1]NJM95054.1 hypothetical protein [Acaryochloridaceae cyanobacterium CSU_5_19]
MCSLVGQLSIISTRGAAQVNNAIDNSNTAESTLSPQLNLDQQGVLSNTQANQQPLGRAIIRNGVSDCTTSGLAISAFGSTIGPFDSGAVGGSFTYTQSSGMEACHRYARSQKARTKLETCLLLISSYSQMKKAGIIVSYQALKKASGIDCPNLTLEQIAPAAISN